MEQNIREYREKHPRCKYCKYERLVMGITSYSYYRCELKDKYIGSLKSDWKGIFCKWFKPKE